MAWPEQYERSAAGAVEPFFQATSIGRYHGTFPSPYSGRFSLQSYPERDGSLTTALFFGLRVTPNTQLYFDPESRLQVGVG
ncbi:MAG TPA: hypothetical protein VLT36_18010, partial [Candidatus Dormibacteraeota bacterium]|nr:hypothetical protein [Candidatus Dormibacteraeota bacterium]